jgi:hypothetical protein
MKWAFVDGFTHFWVQNEIWHLKEGSNVLMDSFMHPCIGAATTDRETEVCDKDFSVATVGIC